MQTHQNHTKNIIPKIKTNKANTHPNTCTERSTNNTRPEQAAEYGRELGKKRNERKEKKYEEKGIGTKSKAKSIMKKGRQYKKKIKKMKLNTNHKNSCTEKDVAKEKR